MNSEKDAAFISAGCHTALKTADCYTVLLSGLLMMKKTYINGTAQTSMWKFMPMWQMENTVW